MRQIVAETLAQGRFQLNRLSITEQCYSVTANVFTVISGSKPGSLKISERILRYPPPTKDFSLLNFIIGIKFGDEYVSRSSQTWPFRHIQTHTDTYRTHTEHIQTHTDTYRHIQTHTEHIQTHTEHIQTHTEHIQTHRDIQNTYRHSDTALHLAEMLSVD